MIHYKFKNLSNVNTFHSTGFKNEHWLKENIHDCKNFIEAALKIN